MGQPHQGTNRFASRRILNVVLPSGSARGRRQPSDACLILIQRRLAQGEAAGRVMPMWRAARLGRPPRAGTRARKVGIGRPALRGFSRTIRGEGADGPAWGSGMGCLMSGSTTPSQVPDDRLRNSAQAAVPCGGTGTGCGRSITAAATAGFAADWPGEPPGLARQPGCNGATPRGDGGRRRRAAQPCPRTSSASRRTRSPPPGSPASPWPGTSTT